MCPSLNALNETYYVGDGNNLHYVAKFAIQPPAFAERVTAILYPQPTANVLTIQYEAMLKLIDDIKALVAQASSPVGQ